MERSILDTDRILVRLPNWVGDAVMASPVLLNLAYIFPLSLIGRPHILELFSSFPHVEELIPIDKGFRSLYKVARRLRGRFEVGLLLPNSFSSALVFRLARVSNVIGYPTDGRGLFIKTKVSLPSPERHQVEYYLNLLKGLDIPIIYKDLRLFLSDRARQRAKNLLANLSSPIATIAPGAAYGPAKRWPWARYRALAFHLKRLGCSLVVLGTQEEYPIAQEILRDLPRCRNLCGLTDLQTAAAIIERSALFVSNDSGLMHVAAALGSPQVAIFGSTDPSRTKPLNPKAVVVRSPVSCSPCLKRVCSKGYICFENIMVSEVLEACLKVLKNSP